MGGFGSGRWPRRQTKATIEGSLILSVGDFYRRRQSKCMGSIIWNWRNGEKSAVGYTVDFGSGPTVTLQYRLRDCEDIQIPIRLQSTPTNFNGERLWFTCPDCGRRVGKVYLPPRARRFSCRHCHDLTYRSSQEAHRTERGTGSLNWIEAGILARKRRGQNG